MILCTISNSINFNHYSFNIHNDISLIRHSICDFVHNLLHTQFIPKNIAFSVSVVAVQVGVPVVKDKSADLDFTW